MKGWLASARTTVIVGSIESRCATWVIPAITIVALACWAQSAQAAEVFRWIDERGVVNYSNEPPPKGATVKDVRVVEDRLSVYTPEKKPEGPPPAAAKPRPGPASDLPLERRAAPPPPPPPVAYDPCVGNESNCYAVVPYPVAPVIPGRQRPPLFVQPELPPGTIAGQSTASGGVIPGQSGTTPVAPLSRPSRKDEPSGSFTLKGKDREPESRR
jgi:Domain of unknown function (DUF4124)